MPNPDKKIYPTFKEYLKDKYEGPYCATDLLVRYNGGLVLIERKFPPFGLAIPGGMAEKMHFHKNSIKEGLEETGLDFIVDKPFYKPLCVLSYPEQDPRAFVSSITFTGVGVGKLMPHPDEDAKNARVLTIEDIANLLDKPFYEPEKKNSDAVWAFKSHPVILCIYLKEREFQNLSEHSKELVLKYEQSQNYKRVVG
ncbi:ADP-ribose pyrophosphatase [uncultured archaeon]|nr:ADP-ribose pyrophosphatase [uncultured archaeon]